MHKIEIDVLTGVKTVIPFTQEEQAEYDLKQAAWAAGANDRKAAEVRAERNAKLSNSDWTQVADAPVDKAVWATYRQALRDVTVQDGFPWVIIWPEMP